MLRVHTRSSLPPCPRSVRPVNGMRDGARSFSAVRQLPKIQKLKAYVVQQDESGADYHRQKDEHWIVGSPISNPMSVYEQYRNWGINALGTVIVEAVAEDGTTGIGTSIGGDPACYIIERHLNSVELIWDQMWRSTMPYGRKGLAIQAMSAVDLAIWDLNGKLRQEPIYQLLGGKTKDRLPVYATTVRPDLAKRLGFKGAKVPLPYSHAEGAEGLKKNVDAIRRYRESVGPDFPLSIDCYMSLTVNYTIELARALEPYKIKWIEEVLPPDDYDGYQRVKQAIGSTMITTGEHEYTRYGFRELIERRCADILQPDITWVGGLTEARRIVAMASAYDIPVIPHGSSVFSYHLQMAYPNCPMAEFLVMSPKADTIVPLFGNLFKDEPLPNNGYLDIPERPGWGVELNYDKLNLHRPYK